MIQIKEPDSEGTQLFAPMMSVVPEYGFNVVLINRWITVTDHVDVSSGFIVTADPLLIRKCDLGIGNHGGKKKCMSNSAFRAFHPADAKANRPGRQLYGSLVVTVDGKTGGMRAGACQLMELKT